MFDPKPLELSTNKITLIPLTMEHLEGFYKAGKDPEVWRWSSPYQCESLDIARNWLLLALEKQEQGIQVPFVIVDNKSKQVIGSTRYTSVNRPDRSLEIGFTFINPEYQRTYVNTHAKYLLLQHAFDVLGAIRVEFKTHEDNNKSRNAILRIGGKFEGVLRNQRILFDGTYRNTALFSIIESEWPLVKQNLLSKIEEVVYAES